MANINLYSKILINGGTVEALDFIDGGLLTDGDQAMVFGANGAVHSYKLNASLGGSETSDNPPSVVKPDTNAGNKRWVHQDPIKSPYSPEGAAIHGYTTKQGTTQDYSGYIAGNPSAAEQGACYLSPKEAGTYFVQGWSSAWSDSPAWYFILYLRTGNSTTYASCTGVAKTTSYMPGASVSGIHNGGVPLIVKWIGTLAATDYVHLGVQVSATGGTTSTIGMNLEHQMGMRFYRLY
jgi:hypothetical protein